MKRITIIIISLLLTNLLVGQVTISRQVIGSTGGTSVGTSIMLTSTVGEANIQTLFSVGNIILTQGFQQPLKGDSIVTYEVINESCPGAKNGSIYISDVKGCPGPYSVDVFTIDDTTLVGQDTLATGNYIVNIYGNNGCSYSTIVNVGLDSDAACELIFYSGITPNGDGKNDAWIIENIEMFPDNYVAIYNRWGNEVWFEEHYDNDKIVWKGNNGNKDEGDEMADATYFYIAVVEGKTYKGWVELTR